LIFLQAAQATVGSYDLLLTPQAAQPLNYTQINANLEGLVQGAAPRWVFPGVATVGAIGTQISRTVPAAGYEGIAAYAMLLHTDLEEVLNLYCLSFLS